jgi:hypothetical protein
VLIDRLSGPKRRRGGKMPSQQHEPDLPQHTLGSSIVAGDRADDLVANKGGCDQMPLRRAS